MNTCAVSNQIADHAKRQGEEDLRNEAWANHRKWLVSVLMSGDVVYLNNRPTLTVNELESEMADDSNVRLAILCCHHDETGAGALLAQAKKDAANRLIDTYEVELRAQFEAPDDEEFFNHIGAA